MIYGAKSMFSMDNPAFQADVFHVLLLEGQEAAGSSSVTHSFNSV